MGIKTASHDKKPKNNGQKPEILIVFHPGKGMSWDEIRGQLTGIQVFGEKAKLYVAREERNKDATLVSPFGTFEGRDRILNGLSAVKNLD